MSSRLRIVMQFDIPGMGLKDALFGNSIVFFVDFHANETAPGMQRGHPTATGPHAIIHNDFTRIGEGPDEVFQERDWFLGPVVACGWVRLVNLDNRGGVLLGAALPNVIGRLEVPVVVVHEVLGLIGVPAPVQRLSLMELGIVGRELLVEYRNLFMLPQWHLFGIQEPSGQHLVPYQ